MILDAITFIACVFAIIVGILVFSLVIANIRKKNYKGAILLIITYIALILVILLNRWWIDLWREFLIHTR